MKPLAEHVKGPIAVALTLDDAVGMAKVLSDYSKKEPKLDIRVGVVEGRVLSAAQLAQVANLPPREVLLAQMLGAMQNPLSGLGRGIARDAATVALCPRCHKGNEGGERRLRRLCVVALSW